MLEFQDLVTRVIRPGRVEWLGRASGRRESIEALDSVELHIGRGLAGDHHAKRGTDSPRQVTLIQAEHLPVITQLSGNAQVTPELLRRNIVVSGTNLLAFKRRQFQIGNALLEGTGSCPPCSRMEENLGPGGYQAMRGHGGITARVLESGEIRVGDPVVSVPEGSPEC